MSDLKRPKGLTTEQWMIAQKIYQSAKKQGDRFPELIVAQAALETEWFKKPSGKNNYFGQKASQSQKGRLVTTKEVSNNKEYVTKQKFRDYDNLDEAISDRIKKWSSKYSNANTPTEALSKIWRYDKNKKSGVGYATDINYGNKVASILNSLGTSLEVDTIQDNEIPQEERTVIQPIDLNSPEYSGTVFSEQVDEETQQQKKEPTVEQTAQELLDESFLEEFQAQQLQEQIPQQQVQDYPQYNIEVKPIEYQPIQMQNGGTKNIVNSFKERPPIVIKESTNVSKDKLPSKKEFINTLPGTNVKTDSKGKFVVKNEKGVYEPYNSNLKTTVSKKETTKTSSQLIAEENRRREEAKKEISDNILKPLDIVTDVMQLGNYVPHPIGQTIGEVGNVVGSLIDSYQAVDNFSNEKYSSGIVNLGSIILPSFLESKTFRRNTKYSSFAPELNNVLGDYGRTTYLNINKQVRNQSKEQLMANRGLLGVLGTETMYDSGIIGNNNTSTDTKDNKQILNTYQIGGSVPVSSNGLWEYPHQQVVVPTQGAITMKKVDYPVFGKSLETGEIQLLQPHKEYFFNNTKNVLETPLFKYEEE